MNREQARTILLGIGEPTTGTLRANAIGAVLDLLVPAGWDVIWEPQPTPNMALLEELRNDGDAEARASIDRAVTMERLNEAIERERADVQRDGDSEYAARGIIATERGARLRAERERDELREHVKSSQEKERLLIAELEDSRKEYAATAMQLAELLMAVRKVLAGELGQSEVVAWLRDAATKTEHV